MAWIKTTAAVSVIALTAGAADAQQKQVVTGPVATYWMSAQTQRASAPAWELRAPGRP